MTGYPLVYTGWTYAGTGAAPVDSEFRITTPATGEANHVYYNTAVNMSDYCSFTADFDFKITPSSSGVADGIAFWFLTNPPTTGVTGSAIGLPTYPHGLILILDTYNNDGVADNPLATLLGYDGTVYQYVEGSTTGVLSPVATSQSFITNGAWHHVKVTYYMGAVNVYFNYSTTATLSGTFSLSGLTGYFGFSGSTGAVYSTQMVKSVDIVGSTCLTPANNGPICSGDTLKLYAIGDSTGATYAWTGPGGFTSTVQDPVIPGATVADSGVYMVIKNGADTGYTDVVIKPKPVVTASSNATICAGIDLTLLASPDSTGETFSWTGPGGFTSAVENPVITAATQADTGFYTVIANWNGCLDTSTTHVNIVNPGTVTAANNTPICSGDTLLLTSTDGVPGVTFNWSGPGGWGNTLQNPIIYNAGTGFTGVYTVTATLSGCTATATTTVQVNPYPPLPNVAPVFPAPCTGTNFTFHVTADTPGATYSWSGPNSFSSTVEDPTISSIGTAAGGSYTVWATFAGCTDSATTHLYVDSTPVTPIVASNSPICSGNTVSLSSSTATSGITYAWSGPGSYNSTDQNPVIVNGNISETGNYTVTVTLTSVHGSCSSSAFTFVQIFQTPSAPIATTNSPVCEGGLLILSSVASPTSGTYYWSGPNSFTSTIEYPQITNVGMAANGVYSVYEVLNGCVGPVSYDTATIMPSPATPNVSSNSPVCEGGTLNLYATDDTTESTISWAGPGGFTSPLADPVLTGMPVSGSGLYIATATLGNCTASSSLNVTITPTPNLTVSNNGPICAGDTLKLFGNSDPGVTFNWSGPFGFGSGSANPTVANSTLENSGVYTVTVTTSASTGSCTNTAFDTALINASPAPPWVTWLTYCQYYDAPQLQAVDASNVLWFSSAAAGGVGTAVAPTPQTDTPGIRYYYLNATANGCTSPIDSIQVTVYPKPSVTATISAPDICPHDSVTLTAIDADPLDVYHWFPATYTYDSLSATTVAYPVTDLQYMVVVTNHFGCTDSAEVGVHVYPAGMIFLGVEDSVTLYAGESYHITPVTNCYELAWFPPAGLSADNIADPVATPTINTMYTVTGITENGCHVQDSLYIHVSDLPLYALPNAFTPGNGANNMFKLIEDGLASLNYFRIFDRWGVLVFETTDLSQGWDGTYKGTAQPQGVYVYEVQAVSAKTNKLFTMRGNITLLR